MLLTFITEYTWVIGALCILTMTGGFIIAPFQDSQKNYLVAAPLAGILVLSLGISALYIVVGLSVKTSSLTIIILCSSLTLITLFFCPPTFKKSDLPNIVIVLFIIAVITYISEYATVSSHGYGLLFKNGIDTPFYANVADWLTNHLASVIPQKDSGEIYQIWPAQLYKADIRFGTYFTLAFFSTFRHLPALFTYDFACAVILSAGILSVSSIFTRRGGITFLLLFVGLFFSDWYDFGRCGYLGKLIIYPSVLYIIGLFFYIQRPVSTRQFFSLITLTYAAACMYPAYAVSLFLLLLSGLFVILPFINIKIFKDKTYLIKQLDNFMIFCVISFFPIASIGILSKVGMFGDLTTYLPEHSAMNLSWIESASIPRLLQLEHFNFSIYLRSHWMLYASILFVAIIIGGLTLSIIKKNYIAFCLLITPIFMILIFSTFKLYWVEYQFIGLFYPLFLCGCVGLFDSLSYDINKPILQNKIYLILFMTVSALIIIQLPRFTWNIRNHAKKEVGQINHQFLKSDFDQLERIIGTSNVTIDIKDIYFSVPLLVELGRRNVHLQFTNESWEAAFGIYLDHIKNPKQLNSNLYLTMLGEPFNKKLCSIQYQTNQCQLIFCNK